MFLVLWGHCIQYLKKDAVFFNDPIFEFIYSFHIPLFFMISGFFFLSSLKLDFKQFLYKKGVQLLLPCFTWAIVFVLFRLGMDLFSGRDLNYTSMLSSLLNPFRWPFWFLKELFISYTLVYIFYKIFKKDWLAFILVIGFVLILPYGNFQRFLLPVFLFGICLKKYFHFIQKHLMYIMLGAFSIFLICLLFWNGEYTVYFTPFPKIFDLKTFTFDFSNLHISLFRLVIGLAGSMSFFLLFQKLYKKNNPFLFLQNVGINSLGIYILQTIILEIAFASIIDLSALNIYIFDLIISPALSILLLMICIYILKIIANNKYIEFLFFGVDIRKINIE